MLFDKSDYAILDLLQREGRLTTVELARRVNLSATPCANRVRRLEDAGIITGYHARLDPARLARSMLVFVQVTLKKTDETALQSFNGAMMGVAEVLECHMVGGGFDYLIKLRVGDMNAYRDFLAGILGAMENVESTHSYFVMEEVKETTLLPLTPKHA